MRERLVVEGEKERESAHPKFVSRYFDHGHLEDGWRLRLTWWSDLQSKICPVRPMTEREDEVLLT